MTKDDLRKLLADWDERGDIKTSLYYRLQSALLAPQTPKETRDEKAPLRARPA